MMMCGRKLTGNKRSNLVRECRHKNKYILVNFVSRCKLSDMSLIVSITLKCLLDIVKVWYSEGVV